MSNKLILRTQVSPYGDETKGSVLSQAELDNNFIFLKGLDINNVNLDGTTLQLNRLNGEVLSVSLDNFVGPAGPAGSDGAPGAQGPAGPAGSGGGGSVTAATYDNSLGVLTLENSDNTTINVTGFFTASNDKYVDTFTFNQANFDMTISRNDGWSQTRSLSILASDMTVTGGTYSSTTGVVTFTTNSGNTFQVTGFSSGYTNIYTSAATYNQTNGDLVLSFTDPTKNLTVTGITSIYNGDGSLQGNRVVNLSGKTLNFSSSTNPNTLVMSGGNVGMGVSNPTNKLHISASTNPVKIEGLTAVSATTKIVATNSNNELVNFSGTVRSIPYFSSAGNSVMTHSPTFTYTDGLARNLQLDDGDLSRSSQITFAGGRGSIFFPASAVGNLTIQCGLSNPFDGAKGILFRNGSTTTNYLLFDTNGNVGGYSSHTAYFGTQIFVNTGTLSLPFWGKTGVATHVASNTYNDWTSSGNTSEVVASSFNRPTFASLSSNTTYSAITNVYIDGAPIAGTNVSALASYALKVNTGTTYFGGDITLSGISTGTTSELLTRETNGNVSFRNLGDIGVISSGNTTLYWYDENDTPPDIRPIASGTNSIALGNAAKALAPNMFVIGTSGGTLATNASGSTFIGDRSGYGATNADSSLFVGDQSGYQASSASDSTFIGFGAGSNASGANSSTFIGRYAGLGGTSSNNSIMIGSLAGYQATSANNSQFFGASAGRAATGATYSFFAGSGAGWLANSVTSSTFIGKNAGSGSTNASYSLFIGENAGLITPTSSGSTFIGFEAGRLANGSSKSNFIGYNAGYQATGVTDSNFFGTSAGYQANGSYSSNFIGINAGINANGSYLSCFIGSNAGYNSSGVTAAVFLGSGAGSGAKNISNSVFIGGSSAGQASNSTGSQFIGDYAGYLASGATYSTFIGSTAGYQAIGTSNSFFVGRWAGHGASGSSNSIMLGLGAGSGASSSTNVIFIGSSAGYMSPNVSNSIMIGRNAASGSSASNVIALGTDVAKGNGLSGQFIISNSNLPSYVDRAAATAAITTGAGAVAGNTYMYYNQTTFAIEGVRL
jgi:hypothetical protein